MTGMRFIGVLPAWLAIPLALAAGLAVWLYYRRDTRVFGGATRWMLPSLRAAAVGLIVLILGGPAIHLRRVEGELGRVDVLIDASESMAVRDPHMDDARRLRVAAGQGWLPEGTVDDSLWRVAESLTEFAAGADSLDAVNEEADAWRRAVDELAKKARRVGAAVKEASASEAWAGASETRASVDRAVRAELVEPALALAEQRPADAAERESLGNDWTRLADRARGVRREVTAVWEAYGQRLRDSGNAAIARALTRFDETTRLERAMADLTRADTGLLAQLAATHRIRVSAIRDRTIEPLWQSNGGDAPPQRLDVAATAPVTDLATALAEAVGVGDGDGEAAAARAAGPRSAVVLLSDGRHNADTPLMQSAAALERLGTPAHAVAFGADREPPDLAVLDIELPDSVFYKNRVRGSLTVKDQMPPGEQATVRIASGDDVLWQQNVTTDGGGERRIEFDFSLRELAEAMRQAEPSEVTRTMVNVPLVASLEPLVGEVDADNNRIDARIATGTRDQRILILDGRSRWETRYLRNLFDRDPQWETTALVVGPATETQSLPRGSEPERFPSEASRLFEYDLIVLGELPPDVLRNQEKEWLREYVQRGGGMILVDGTRGHLRSLAEGPLGDIIPVEWSENEPAEPPGAIRLTAAGAREPALRLEADREENQRFWQQLPAPQAPRIVRPLPGAEVWAEVIVDGRTAPLLLSRTVGAGRVAYLASDETWRWRYEVADTYHARFWNQLSRAVMQQPFAVSDRFVSLDVGAPLLDAGESTEVRVRLRGPDGLPLSDRVVDALLWRDGRVVSTTNLELEDPVRGLYRGSTPRLPAGDYTVTVRASGFNDERIAATAELKVQPERSRELLAVGCDPSLLGAVSAVSGGRFVREEDLGELVEVLRPLSSGRVIESDILLTQTYLWFTAIMGLLGVEWLWRKRAGLM